MANENFEIYFPGSNYLFPMIFVNGTGNETYLFGDNEKAGKAVSNFFISKFPVTQQFWGYIMDSNPSHFKGQGKPVENVSFHDITATGGFLYRLNNIALQKFSLPAVLNFRLPSETEWEYAAKGGVKWKDNFTFGGSNNIDEVGWYLQNSGPDKDTAILSTLKNHEKGTTTHTVGQKQVNQLGIADMCGNVWEWCQDHYQNDIHQIPADGKPYGTPTPERVLRGGCHHNQAIHCTVSKRYASTPEAKDECIGFRIAASIGI